MVSPESPEMVIPADSPCDIASFFSSARGKEERERESERKEKKVKGKRTERERTFDDSLNHRSVFFFAWFSFFFGLFFPVVFLRVRNFSSLRHNFPVLAPIIAT